jgi:hypothetical protein
MKLAVTHSALLLADISALPLKLISYRAISYNMAGKHVVINGSHRNYRGKALWELIIKVRLNIDPSTE